MKLCRVVEIGTEMEIEEWGWSEVERGAGVQDNRIRQADFIGFSYGNTICRTAQ